MVAARARTNWAGNVTFGTALLHEPASLEELQELVAASTCLHAVGSAHSFTPVADSTGALVSLRRLGGEVAVDTGTRRAWLPAGASHAEVAVQLDAAGWALGNLASLPQITVAGAAATATHGSGRTNPCLAAAVTAVDLVRADGRLVRIDDPDRLAGSVVALGALGIVVALEVEVEPSYDVRVDVYEDLPLPAAMDHLDELLGCAYSVSLFVDWREPEVVKQVWVKSRLARSSRSAVGHGPGAARPGGGGDERPGTAGGAALDPGAALPGAMPGPGAALPGATPGPTVPERLGAMPATRPRHPIAGLDPSGTVAQLGETGRWHERLPHFRSGATPSSGDELQSEWLVPRAAGSDALRRLRVLAPRLARAVQVSEIRAVAADELWLSPAHGRDSVALHFTWRNDLPLVEPLVREVEEILRPLSPRPHWAKLFAMPPDEVAAAYPRLPDFRALAAELDPDRHFANPMVGAYLLS